MPTKTSRLDLAIETLLEGGPKAARPFVARLIARAPELDAQRAELLQAEARAIEVNASALAAESWIGGSKGLKEGRAELARRYPQLQSSTLDKLWQHGEYCAWHELGMGG
jgi:hypothetical protein